MRLKPGTTPATRDYAAIARGYATDVVRGRIVTGKQIRLQCQRFLDELKQSRTAAFPFRFDEAKAARPCRFIEMLPHSKGKWARSKERLVLQPWQVWIIAVTFGWVHKAGRQKDLRRFRRLLVVVPRKNGKSALAAGLALYMLCADGEFGAEVYSGATNEKQAWEVFKPARVMVDRTPGLRRKFGLEVTARTIVRVDDASKMETITGDPGDGQSPSCSVHDEYHEHVDDRQVDTMITGMGARDQPLQLLITTAGSNLAGPCYAMIREEREKLAGIGHAKVGGGGGPPLHDITLFVEYAADPEDDWKAEATLVKANPNFGISVGADFLLAEQRDAILKPRRRATFKTKHLNIWVAAKTAYFDIEAWRRCRVEAVPMRAVDALADPRLAGRRCILALDLASIDDIAALEYLFPPLGGEATPDDPYIRVGRYFLPADTVENVPRYAGWHAEQLLDVTDGPIIDYEAIEEAIDEACVLFDVEQVAYDPHQATMLVTRLMKKQVPVVEYRPLVILFSEPMKQLDGMMKAQTLHHGGCPVMEWQVANVVAQPDKKDNVYPNKPRADAKIDNPVALIMAIGVALSGKIPEKFEYTGM